MNRFVAYLPFSVAVNCRSEEFLRHTRKFLSSDAFIAAYSMSSRDFGLPATDSRHNRALPRPIRVGFVYPKSTSMTMRIRIMKPTSRNTSGTTMPNGRQTGIERRYRTDGGRASSADTTNRPLPAKRVVFSARPRAGSANALPAFIEHCDWERPHSACGGLPPMSRIVGVNNLLAHNT